MVESSKTSGNVLFLILIAVALFAALSYAVTSSSRGGSNNGSTEKEQLQASNILNYQASIKVAIDRMVISGTPVENIDFSRPEDAGFDTAPYTNKLFHPQGGGVAYQNLSLTNNEVIWRKTVDYAYLLMNHLNPVSTAYATIVIAPHGGGGGHGAPIGVGGEVTKAAYVGRFNNFAWSPTSEWDIVMAVTDIPKGTCAAINDKLNGNRDIPVVSDAQQYLVSADYTAGSNSDLSSAECPECENHDSFCIADDPDEGPFYYYNLVVSR